MSLEEALEDDPEVLRELLAEFLRDNPEELVKLEEEVKKNRPRNSYRNAEAETTASNAIPTMGKKTV